jgi:hypothetical protein
MTKLQQAAYDAQLAAGLPISRLASEILADGDGLIPIERCARYCAAVQQTIWFQAAFASHNRTLQVTGGRGISQADREQYRIKIGATDRRFLGRCERACLHELAHIVTRDAGLDGSPREPRVGRASSKGHHYAWRVNFVFLVAMVIGRPAAARLRQEFNQWGLPTRK